MTQLPELPPSPPTLSQIGNVLARQDTINERLGKAMQALALTEERLDDEIAAVREQMSAIRARLGDIDYRLEALERPTHLHSVKVEP